MNVTQTLILTICEESNHSAGGGSGSAPPSIIDAIESVTILAEEETNKNKKMSKNPWPISPDMGVLGSILGLDRCVSAS